MLLCRVHGARPDLDVMPLTSENLPNGGICTKCGADVLIPPAADPQPVRHAPGTAILCADCRAKGHAVCMDDAASQPGKEPRP